MESFTTTLKELSMEQGRLLAENERLHNLLGDGGAEREPVVREPADAANAKETDGDEDEEQPNE